MRIVVASNNPAKIEAVRSAFGDALEGVVCEIRSLSVPSGVRDQPLEDDETRRGAVNRARTARDRSPEADFWVGQEGGLERIDGAWLASAWMAVLGRDGRLGLARTPTLPLPPAVQALLEQGLELGEANDRVFGTRDSKRKGGAFGLLTAGRLTRGGIYAETLSLALIPHLHELWGDVPQADL